MHRHIFPACDIAWTEVDIEKYARTLESHPQNAFKETDLPLHYIDKIMDIAHQLDLARVFSPAQMTKIMAKRIVQSPPNPAAATSDWQALKKYAIVCIKASEDNLRSDVDPQGHYIDSVDYYPDIYNALFNELSQDPLKILNVLAQVTLPEFMPSHQKKIVPYFEHGNTSQPPINYPSPQSYILDNLLECTHINTKTSSNKLLPKITGLKDLARFCIWEDDYDENPFLADLLKCTPINAKPLTNKLQPKITGIKDINISRFFLKNDYKPFFSHEKPHKQISKYDNSYFLCENKKLFDHFHSSVMKYFFKETKKTYSLFNSQPSLNSSAHFSISQLIDTLFLDSTPLETFNIFMHEHLEKNLGALSTPIAIKINSVQKSKLCSEKIDALKDIVFPQTNKSLLKK